MEIILTLIGFPAIIGILMFAVPSKAIRKMLAVVSTIVLTALPVYLAYLYIGGNSVYLNIKIPHVAEIMLVIELVLALVLLYMAVRAKKYLAILFIVIQAVAMLVFELKYGHSIVVEHNIFLDKLSIIMALIIGIIGSLINQYAIGYMEEFHHHHHEMKDTSGFFFLLMYVFLSAMFGIVFSNNILWIYFFWEITTICSFLLIGYKKDEESVRNSFRALVMNLGGGIAFTIGIIFLFLNTNSMELDKMVHSDKALVLVPGVLMAFAGLTKSAQMPFSVWLTGAMVAPTPVSALLHSSTMVKAGVYLILKVAPALYGTNAALMLSFVGGATFLATAFIAVSQSNAKRVLAYSTISNLGLVVACAGINSQAAMWSAILLIIFHAVAKSLLFLCVGVVEHKIGSRDIEDMDHLITTMPKVAAMMIVGICGMFLAPFGMLISKYITLKAFIDFNPVLAILLAFGSATTLFFWTKWMGKIVMIKLGVENKENTISIWEWFTLGSLALGTIAVCALFPIISSKILEPYTRELFGHSPSVDFINMVLIMVIMIALIILLPVGLLRGAYSKGYKEVGTYLGGGNLSADTYLGSIAIERGVSLRNYYLENFFGEKKMFWTGVVAAVVLIIIMFGVAVI